MVYTHYFTILLGNVNLESGGWQKKAVIAWYKGNCIQKAGFSWAQETKTETCSPFLGTSWAGPTGHKPLTQNPGTQIRGST